MATSAQAGFEAEFAISTDGGSTHNIVSEQSDMTLTAEGEALDASHFNSAGVRDFIAGPYQWNFTVEGNFLQSDAGQTDVFNEITAPAQVDIRIRPVGTATGDVEYTGTAVLTSWEVGSTADDVVSFSAEGTGSGALTKATI